MWMDKTLVVRIIQALTSFLAVVGIQVSPENQDAIVQGWMALMGILMSIKGLGSKDAEETAKKQAELDLIANQIKTEQIKREVYRSRLKK